MTEETTTSLRVPAESAAWFTFARERFQIPAVLIFGAAQSTSAQFVVSSALDWVALVVSISGISVLLVVMRMMDELKDLDKDRIAHPDRPLPRGLISPEEVRYGLRISIGVLLCASILIGLLGNPIAGTLLGLSVGYSLLMYREFFIPEFLDARPFSYAATHQVIIIPIYAFATATAVPEAVFTRPVLWFAMTGLGASFALEVCRKLDPEAHPALRTYLTVSGPGRTAIAVAASVLLAVYGAYKIGVFAIMGPVALVLLASLVLTMARPARFKWTAGFAGLFVLAQVFAPTIDHLVEVLS